MAVRLHVHDRPWPKKVVRSNRKADVTPVTSAQSAHRMCRAGAQPGYGGERAPSCAPRIAKGPGYRPRGGCGRPRGPWLSVPASGQRRHRRAALGGGSAAGSMGGARWCASLVVGPMAVQRSVLTGGGRSFVKHRPGYASPGATVSTGCGRSRASPGPTTPSDVTGLLSPADRSRHRNEVPRRGPRQAAGVSSFRSSARGAASTRSPAGRAWLAWHREQRSPAAAGHAPYG